VRALQKLLASGNVAFPKCEKYQYAAVEAMTNWQIDMATSQFLNKYFSTKTAQIKIILSFSLLLLPNRCKHRVIFHTALPLHS
jgi:hypothetical protein